METLISIIGAIALIGAIGVGVFFAIAIIVERLGEIREDIYLRGLDDGRKSSMDDMRQYANWIDHAPTRNLIRHMGEGCDMGHARAIFEREMKEVSKER